MIIRQQQIRVLSDERRSRFERRMHEHLSRCFPAECGALGEGGTDTAIRNGVQRAAAYGIHLERDVCKYIDLMFALGQDFDAREDLPWASAIINDDTCANSSIKMDRLYAAAKANTMQAEVVP